MQDVFLKSVSGQERRNVCIKYIDEGVLKRGTSLQEVQKAFGPFFRLTGGKTDQGLKIGLVQFEEVTRGSTPEEGSAGYTGWYLVIHFSGAGIVDYYYLTNLHK